MPPRKRPQACYEPIRVGPGPLDFHQCHRPQGHEGAHSTSSPDCALNRCDCRTTTGCYYCGHSPSASVVSQHVGNKQTLKVEVRELRVCQACAPRVPHVLFITPDDAMPLEAQLHALVTR